MIFKGNFTTKLREVRFDLTGENNQEIFEVPLTHSPQPTHVIVYNFFVNFNLKFSIKFGVFAMPLISSKNIGNANKTSFFNALDIYLTKQQVVNRKLSAISNIYFKKVENFDWKELKIYFEIEGERGSSEACDKSSIFNHAEDTTGTFLSLDKLIPRSSKFHSTICLTLIGK